MREQRLILAVLLAPAFTARASDKGDRQLHTTRTKHE
jgi:hypothetical protein